MSEVIVRREYLVRQPRVGDRIVVTNKIGGAGLGYENGNEMVIVEIETATGNCVLAIGERNSRVCFLMDREYRIFRDIKIRRVGEETVVKRFLGIPYQKITREIYEEVG